MGEDGTESSSNNTGNEAVKQLSKWGDGLTD